MNITQMIENNEIPGEISKFTYESVQNDPYGVRLYTLRNGLKVYLAQNKELPRIQTYIAVRTGSNRDPKDNTGLAHYLEHMMFKGTSKIGALDWEKENEYLAKISLLYERHKEAQDPLEKKEIYKEIDRLSREASELAVAGEYDKLLSSLGATGTNAHTWLDETVYKNNIPSNELERWLTVEKERFSELTLRLFHTELETVYEEFNRAQDQDQRAVNEAMMSMLFPSHPNGQHTTIGKPEHLKNPSMKAIHAYFDQYYVPNNYAMVLVGDLEFDRTIELIEATFGTLKPVELPEEIRVKEEPLTSVQKKVVLSPSNPRLHVAWRTPSYGERGYYILDLISSLLSNQGEAGLLDLDINSKQKALYAGSYTLGFLDYGLISLLIVPKETQTLQEAKKLLFEAIEKIKTGNYPDWMLSAILNDFKFQRLKSLESSDGLATVLYQSYIRGQSWREELEEIEVYDSITKEEISEYATQFFGENYVEIYKEKGENPELLRVENPGITPIKLNQEAKSEFFDEIAALDSEPISPQFIDYSKEIHSSQIKGKDLSFVPNPINERSHLNFIFPFGKDHGKEFELAVSLLSYLGTSEKSNEEIKLAFYKLGITYQFQVTRDEILFTLYGLKENMPEGIRLLSSWLSEVKEDEEVYQELIQTIEESRTFNKNDKNTISKALKIYAQYGENSSFRDVFSIKDLMKIPVTSLTEILRKLPEYPFELFYYGPELGDVQGVLEELIPNESYKVPAKKTYEVPEGSEKVYFTPYDMVQVELHKVGRAGKAEIENFGKVSVFNEYFGSGLSSIVFQQVRESKSLAYSAYANFQNASKKEDWNFLSTFLGTQPDKLPLAMETMEQLMQSLPYYPAQFESSKKQALKRIASGRIIKTALFFSYHSLKKLGIYEDIRKTIYEQIENLSFEDLSGFYQERIASVKLNSAYLGREDQLKLGELSPKGEYIKLSLENLFNY